MTWSSYFTVVGIVYSTYYGINIAYDVIVYYKKKAKLEKQTQEYDLSHLNAQNEPVHQPKKVSQIINTQVEPTQPLTLDNAVVDSLQPTVVSLEKRDEDALPNRLLPLAKIVEPQPIESFLDEKEEILTVAPSTPVLTSEKEEVENPQPIVVSLEESEENLTIEEFYAQSLNEFSLVAKRIYKNEDQEEF
jgi:uncharacterized ParB-like nuclease family protein